MKCFLSERHCKAFLNKESLYYRANIRAGVLQCSILGSIFFFLAIRSILIMATLSMTNLIMKLFIRDFNHLNTVQPQAQQEHSEVFILECLIDVPRGNYFFDFSPPRTFLFQPPRLLILGGGGGVSNLDKLFETIYLC